MRELIGQRVGGCRDFAGALTQHTLACLGVVLAMVIFAGAVSADALDISISASRDDAEEKSDGNMVKASSDLELVIDRGDNQTVGMRFTSVAIPQGATIRNASIQFTVDEPTTQATALTIVGEASDSAARFSSTPFDISSRSQTTAAVAWVPPPWTTVGSVGTEQRTPDLAAVIQEIVSRPGWSSGNALVIIITGSGKRVAESYNGDHAAAPLLHVEFDGGLQIEPPTVDTLTTDDPTPTITGIWDPDAANELTVTVDGVLYTLGDGSLSNSGANWSLIIPPGDALSDGTYDVTATVSDGAGNSVDDPTAGELVIDSRSGAPCDPADFSPGAAQFTHGPIVGAARARSAKIGFRTDTQACVQIKYATNPDLTGAVMSEGRLTGPFGDHTGKIIVTQLKPGTTYYYTVVVNGLDTAFPELPRFKTFPRSRIPAALTFGVLTDLGSQQPAPAMASLAQENPDFVVILGDYDHRNPRTLAEMRVMHREVREERASGPDLRDNILRQFPVAHVWDDHDYGANNADKNFPAGAEALKAFDEYWPGYSRRSAGEKDGIWHSFKYGRLAEIFMLDLRSQRDVSRDRDDADKSMLDGDVIPNSQKVWLKESLRASEATWKFIASSVPWNPTVPKQDAWYGFQTEQQELVDFIYSEGITGVIFFSGDIHLGGAIDDASNAYFPEMNVPHTNNLSDDTTCGGSDDCGAWSEGWDPGGGGY
ncbi:MAG: alkaline phosphatase D family protein, partial [Gammaproteobacteria bacterium]